MSWQTTRRRQFSYSKTLVSRFPCAVGLQMLIRPTGHVHADSAASLVRLIRAKEGVEEVESELASFQRSLENDHGMTADAADVLKRDLAVQTILHVGSRSFSHFLNVLERSVLECPHDSFHTDATTLQIPHSPSQHHSFREDETGAARIRRNILATKSTIPFDRPRQAPSIPTRRLGRRHRLGIQSDGGRQDEEVERYR